MSEGSSLRNIGKLADYCLRHYHADDSGDPARLLGHVAECGLDDFESLLEVLKAPLDLVVDLSGIPEGRLPVISESAASADRLGAKL